MKTLVAYFSASGRTEEKAQSIAEILGADIFEIVPEVLYTKDDLNWTNKNSRSSIEMADKSSRPAVKNTLSNMADYDTIFLGFPIWWYEAPTIICTFLENYDFSGKTIIPFFTSGGSGYGETEAQLKPLAQNATWKPGKNLTLQAKAGISRWIKSL